MTVKQVKQLQPGDEVYWQDPDGGLCSRNIIIWSIEVSGNVVVIQGKDGSDLECFAQELR